MRKLKNEELGRIPIEAYGEAAKLNACLILDDVRSLHNVGSAFRTSDAFRVAKVWLCGITGTPPHREINKTALGATESVEWEHAQDIVDLIRKLKAEGWTIAGIEQADASVSLEKFQPDPERKYAFVFGNEVYGVSDQVIGEADLVLEIPQFGTKHSLNISVSIGVVLWGFLVKGGMQALR